MNETIDTQITDTTIDSQTTDATQMPQLPPQPPMFGQAPMMQFGGMSFGGQLPALDGTQPTFDASQMPTFDGTQQAFDPTQMPTFDGTQQAFDPTQMPALDGTQQVSIDGAQQLGQPPMMQFGGMAFGGQMQFGGQQFGQGFMPQADMNMWGNSEFLGEQMFNGENFAAPDDLGTITDTNADISVNFGEQNGFGFGFGFPPAGMPPVMDGGQVPEQSTSTETQAE